MLLLNPLKSRWDDKTHSLQHFNALSTHFCCYHCPAFSAFSIKELLFSLLQGGVSQWYSVNLVAPPLPGDSYRQLPGKTNPLPVFRCVIADAPWNRALIKSSPAADITAKWKHAMEPMYCSSRFTAQYTVYLIHNDASKLSISTLNCCENEVHATAVLFIWFTQD